MIALLVSALTLGLRIEVPLHLNPGFRTFPEIAALVGETPTEVRCDPEIAHRMVFASAKSISREGLLGALGLILVPDGKRRMMKDADAKIEREWATRVREALARRTERTLQAAIDMIGTGTRTSGDEWYRPYRKALDDPKATVKERAKADQAWLEAFGARLVGDGRPESVAAIRTLAAFPSTVPVELLETGRVVDTLPFASLPAPALAALRRAYPELKGGPDSLVVRRRILGGSGALGLNLQIGIVDPGVIVPPTWGTIVGPTPEGPDSTQTGALLRADAERTILLRTFRDEIAALRKTEVPGRALADTYADEVPPKSLPGATSLSQIVEVWGRKGHDVIQELDPASEGLDSVFSGARLRRDGDWSPQSVEGVLVLRPLLRFLDVRRRFPLAALLTLEASDEKPQSRRYGAPFISLAGQNAYAEAVRNDGRWGPTNYRGFEGSRLDSAAQRRRVLDLIPPAIRAEAERILKTKRAEPLPTGSNRGYTMRPVAGTWTVPLAQLAPSLQARILAEMRADDGETGSVAAYSPAATPYILREGFMEVTVRDSLQGYVISCSIGADLTPLGVKGPGPWIGA